jgi:glycosyltransferase involved in cell wall biosynthesis
MPIPDFRLPISDFRPQTPERSALPAKIRVLFAIGEMSGGGSQRQLIGILQRLDRARFEPQLYVVTSGGPLLSEVPPDVPVHFFDQSDQPPRWTYPGQAHRARVRHLARLLEEQRIDVVYDRTYHMTLITAGAVQRRPTARISVIVTDPERDFETNPERFKWIKRLLLKRAYQTADRVVGVSAGVHSAAIARYQLDPKKTLTLSNFFDIERIDRLMAVSLPAGATKPPGRFEIVAAGRLHPQKGFGFLLASLREIVHNRGHKHAHLRIFGIGPQEAELRAFVANHQLEPHVTFAGFQANPLPYYHQADLFCLSSLYEGMPNALVEALLCRVPVLATDCPSGPREVLDDGRFGRLIPPADVSALAASIEEAIVNRDRWLELVEPARTHIEHTFSPAAGIERLHALFQDVLRR